MLEPQVTICLVSPLFLVFLLLSSPRISEEIANRHSPLTGRRTCGATPRLIKFEIVEMISGAATQAARLSSAPTWLPCYNQCVRAVWQVEGVFVCISVRGGMCYYAYESERKGERESGAVSVRAETIKLFPHLSHGSKDGRCHTPHRLYNFSWLENNPDRKTAMLFPASPIWQFLFFLLLHHCDFCAFELTA